eukprot:CAMPEP_0114278660 /NCGR_PEP_ID=MMETSP0059-20121206/1456_1 /TAXON_ID=36894 /ORGANISM="Pyramimonas parkeae, Strain CCMP726" /LENGTH=328 /DNA_ID=CAMNT_0001398875 /DNA_START=297 /DNA_END=1280 /DNA_ORIENTATION=-
MSLPGECIHVETEIADADLEHEGAPTERMLIPSQTAAVLLAGDCTLDPDHSYRGPVRSGSQIGVDRAADDLDVVDIPGCSSDARYCSISEVDNGVGDTCRICHEPSELPNNPLIDLGCACKKALGQTHQVCAEIWFGRKRSRMCEVCRTDITIALYAWDDNKPIHDSGIGTFTYEYYDADNEYDLGTSSSRRVQHVVRADHRVDLMEAWQSSQSRRRWEGDETAPNHHESESAEDTMYRARLRSSTRGAQSLFAVALLMLLQKSIVTSNSGLDHLGYILGLMLACLTVAITRSCVVPLFQRQEPPLPLKLRMAYMLSTGTMISLWLVW